MKIFYKQFTVKPQPDNENFEILKGAIADMWIVADNIDDAIIKARDYLDSYFWIVEEMEPNVLESTTEQLLESGKSLLPEVKKALLYGIGCNLIGYVKE